MRGAETLREIAQHLPGKQKAPSPKRKNLQKSLISDNLRPSMVRDYRELDIYKITLTVALVLLATTMMGCSVTSK